MRGGCSLVIIGWLSITSVLWRSTQAATLQNQVSRSTPPPTEAFRALLNRYCVTCHNERAKTAGLMLDRMDLSNVPVGADVWEKVVRKLRAGMMPPQGMPRPERGAQDAVVAWLESTLDREATAKPDPGRALLHRLNRAEYENAVRDLLALDVDVASLLPPDDSSYGFDNIADALGVSPVLLERYLSAAEKISALAVGDRSIVPSDESYRVRLDLTQTKHIDGLPVGTRGGMLIRRTFPLDAEYVIQPRLWRTNVGFIRGLAHPHQVEVTVDGERVHLVTVGTPEDFRTSVVGGSKAASAIEARLRVRVPVKAGARAIGVSFLEKSEAEPPTLLQPFESALDPVDSDGVPQIENVVISGPFNVKGPGDTASRRRIFVCRSESATDEAHCARKVVSTLARRAYRRPVAEADLRPLLDFYNTGRRKGTFETGIQLAVERILADPQFVFRAEHDPANVAPGTVFRINDLDLASRLSFFLWSSIPDDSLMTLAVQGKLRNPAVLDQQVRRMLVDPRAQSLTSNFAGQWLYLRNLKNVIPDKDEFPDFDDNLRQAMRRETELLFESMIHEDRNVLDLLTADYTFVNERLARHYGIPNIYGSRFRRVVVPSEARRGLLGQGSILTVTARADRTSPVLRGKWILENLLGTPPPPPPPDVPPLKENKERDKPLTMREQMEEHRANPACASCHKLMDPLGFSLENFDAVGAWRLSDAGTPISASTQLADGTKIDGPVALRQALLRQPEAFVRTMTEKLLTYALGRGLEYYDMPVVRSIVRDAARQDYRFLAI
jgi:hypothetical protein